MSSRVLLLVASLVVISVCDLLVEITMGGFGDTVRFVVTVAAAAAVLLTLGLFRRARRRLGSRAQPGEGTTTRA